jgi:hypothetical protein
MIGSRDYFRARIFRAPATLAVNSPILLQALHT